MTPAKLRELARGLEIPLDDEDLTRLRPMVVDLLAVAQRLRRHYVAIVAEPGTPAGSSAPSG